VILFSFNLPPATLGGLFAGLLTGGIILILTLLRK
jgi:hypothetical protein